jgi:hypothetical protein
MPQDPQAILPEDFCLFSLFISINSLLPPGASFFFLFFSFLSFFGSPRFEREWC